MNRRVMFASRSSKLAPKRSSIVCFPEGRGQGQTPPAPEPLYSVLAPADTMPPSLELAFF